MENKFKKGDVVYDKISPGRSLRVIRYFKGIYYCVTDNDKNDEEIVYLEKDLIELDETKK